MQLTDIPALYAKNDICSLSDMQLTTFVCKILFEIKCRKHIIEINAFMHQISTD